MDEDDDLPSPPTMAVMTTTAAGFGGNGGIDCHHNQHPLSSIQQTVCLPLPLPPQGGEYIVPPHSQFEIGSCLRGAPAYPDDPYYGSLLSYGAATPVIPHLHMGVHQARMPLPISSEMMEEEPVYVNAKQYHGILRRRQCRAKLESNRVYRSRKPYLHESRHQHALRRPRGCGGRFLNTKALEAAKKQEGLQDTTERDRSQEERQQQPLHHPQWARRQQQEEGDKEEDDSDCITNRQVIDLSSGEGPDRGSCAHHELPGLESAIAEADDDCGMQMPGRSSVGIVSYHQLREAVCARIPSSMLGGGGYSQSMLSHVPGVVGALPMGGGMDGAYLHQSQPFHGSAFHPIPSIGMEMDVKPVTSNGGRVSRSGQQTAVASH